MTNSKHLSETHPGFGGFILDFKVTLTLCHSGKLKYSDRFFLSGQNKNNDRRFESKGKKNSKVKTSLLTVTTWQLPTSPAGGLYLPFV